MDQELIDTLIHSLKRIIEENRTIKLPEQGNKDTIELKSSRFYFWVDLNFSGRKKPKCTFQLREQERKNSPLLRLDVMGAPHRNPVGDDIPYSGEIIPCPHLHIIHPDYETRIAYPLTSKHAKMYLTEDDLEDVVVTLVEFLKYCNVVNLDDFEFTRQESLLS